MTVEVSVEVACVDCDTDLVGTLDGRNVEDRAATPELNEWLAWAGATPC